MKIQHLLGLLFLCLLPACKQLAPPTKPNIIILFTDDQRYNTVHALGNDAVSTPNMDRLVEAGTSFTRAHMMGGMHGALCAPSRAMLLTGRNLFGLQQSGNVLPEEHTLMPRYFAEQGYTTFGTGKWHHSKTSFNRAFDHGDNIFFGGMHFPENGGHEAPQLYHYDATGTYDKADQWQIQKFSSMQYADAAISFLNRQKDASNPFFAYVAFSSPHDPRTPPEPYRSRYQADDIELPESFLPEHPFDNGELKVRDEMLLPHPRTPEAIKNEIALYYGMVSEVDAQIGRILDTLEKNGQLENTIVVFAGDNGLAVGNHGLLGKQSVYDHSMRVPFVIAGPGIPQNQRREALVYLFDIFPTLNELLGNENPATVQGKSLVPVLEADTPVREYAYSAYRDVQRAIRTEDNWKLILYDVNDVQHTQLFNLNEDPNETQNLETQFPEKVASMRALMHEEAIRLNDFVDIDKPRWGKSAPEKTKLIEHLGKGKKVSLSQPFSPKYAGIGEKGLVDGILCTSDFKMNCWHAFEQDNLEATIDLGQSQSVNEVVLHTIRSLGSWIFLPTMIEISISQDGKTFETVATKSLPEAEPEDMEEKMALTLKVGKSARYVRIFAKNEGICPKWHAGAGGKAWLFVDEIEVR